MKARERYYPPTPPPNPLKTSKVARKPTGVYKPWSNYMPLLRMKGRRKGPSRAKARDRPEVKCIKLQEFKFPSPCDIFYSPQWIQKSIKSTRSNTISGEWAHLYLPLSTYGFPNPTTPHPLPATAGPGSGFSFQAAFARHHRHAGSARTPLQGRQGCLRVDSKVWNSDIWRFP